MYDIEELPVPCCTICGGMLDWIDCYDCGGEGYLDWQTLQEEDPLWYDMDDIVRCIECHGRGGWWECLNYERHTNDKEA